jgi:hypothetical protein
VFDERNPWPARSAASLFAAPSNDPFPSAPGSILERLG